MGKTYNNRTLTAKELPRLSSPVLLCVQRADYDKAIEQAGEQSSPNGEFVENKMVFVEEADEFVEKFVERGVLRTIVRLMIEQPKISAAGIAEDVQMTPRGVQKNIAILKKQGLVERIGSARGSYWVVKRPE
jgi:predicted HTH transcriptional regulator